MNFQQIYQIYQFSVNMLDLPIFTKNCLNEALFCFSSIVEPFKMSLVSMEDTNLMEVAEAAAKNCTLSLEHITALNISSNWTILQRYEAQKQLTLKRLSTVVNMINFVSQFDEPISYKFLGSGGIHLGFNYLVLNEKKQCE
jgi:hypothetical protein